MPKVGTKEFSYSASGRKKAKEYAKKTGKKINWGVNKKKKGW